jgi:hypothetical protein
MACRLMGTERQVPVARELAVKVKRALREQVGECLTCSIGIAPNVFLGKVGASRCAGALSSRARLEERLGRRPARSHDPLSLISRGDSGRLRLRKDFLRTFYPFAISKRHSLILASEFRSIPAALLPDAPEGLCPPQ